MAIKAVKARVAEAQVTLADAALSQVDATPERTDAMEAIRRYVTFLSVMDELTDPATKLHNITISLK